MERYDVGEVLGRGTFGVVRLARKKTTGELRAIKYVEHAYENWQAASKSREFVALHALAHCEAGRNVVRVYDIIRESSGCLYFVLDYMEDGSLHNLVAETVKRRISAQRRRQHQHQQHGSADMFDNAHLGQQHDTNINVSNKRINGTHADRRSPLDASRSRSASHFDLDSISDIASITQQILLGVRFIHGKDFIHRDMKPENVLISGRQVKISDLGLARCLANSSTSTMTSYVGTRWYRAPELILGDRTYSKPADLFAVGCIMYEISTLRPLFPGTDEIKQLAHILELCGSLKEYWPKGHRILNSKDWTWATQMPAQTEMHDQAGPMQNQIRRESRSVAYQNLCTHLPSMSHDGISLMEALLHLDPQKRPTATQALDRYDFVRRHPKATKRTLQHVRGQDATHQRSHQHSFVINVPELPSPAISSLTNPKTLLQCLGNENASSNLPGSVMVPTGTATGTATTTHNRMNNQHNTVPSSLVHGAVDAYTCAAGTDHRAQELLGMHEMHEYEIPAVKRRRHSPLHCHAQKADSSYGFEHQIVPKRHPFSVLDCSYEQDAHRIHRSPNTIGFAATMQFPTPAAMPAAATAEAEEWTPQDIFL